MSSPLPSPSTSNHLNSIRDRLHAKAGLGMLCLGLAMTAVSMVLLAKANACREGAHACTRRCTASFNATGYPDCRACAGCDWDTCADAECCNEQQCLIDYWPGEDASTGGVLLSLVLLAYIISVPLVGSFGGSCELGCDCNRGWNSCTYIASWAMYCMSTVTALFGFTAALVQFDQTVLIIQGFGFTASFALMCACRFFTAKILLDENGEHAQRYARVVDTPATAFDGGPSGGQEIMPVVSPNAPSNDGNDLSGEL